MTSLLDGSSTGPSPVSTPPGSQGISRVSSFSNQQFEPVSSPSLESQVDNINQRRSLSEASAVGSSKITPATKLSGRHNLATSLRKGWATFTHAIHDGWLSELLAAGFSLACCITIGIILSIFEDRPSPNLTIKGLTLNTLVSIFATSSKSALLYVVAESVSQLKWAWFQRPRKLEDLQTFDDASRGPLGALTLFATRPMLSVASVGAVVTVLALVFDPFVQQVLAFSVRQHWVDSNITTVNQATYPFYNVRDINLDAYSAVKRGFYSGTGFDYILNCPTGNCTWPSFMTVEYCSKCENITPLATLEDCNFNITMDENQEDQQFSTNCSLKFPDGRASATITTAYIKWNLSMHVLSPEVYSWTRIYNLDTQPSDFFMLGNEGLLSTWLDVPEADVAIVFAGFNVEARRSPGPDDTTWSFEWELELQNATQCVLYPCLRSYNISTISGTPNVTLKSSKYGEYWSLERDSEDWTCWQGIPGAVNLRSESDTIGGSPLLFDHEKFTFCREGGPQRSSLWLARMFLVNLVQNTWFGEPQVLIQSSVVELQPEALITLIQTADDVQHLFTKGFNRTFEDIATSLSQALRASQSFLSMGRAATSIVYVEVRWIWLLLPAAITLAGIALLIATIVITRRQRVPRWKASVLALLYHGLDGDIPPGGEKVSGMVKTAISTSVQLLHSEKEGRLVLRKE